MEALTKDSGGEYTTSQQEVTGFLVGSMFHMLGMLSGATGKAIMVESSHEQCELSIIASEVPVEASEAPRKVSVSSSATSKVSVKEGEAIPSLGDEAAGNVKGL